MPGRKKHAEQKIGVKVRLPAKLHAQVTLILLDPLRGKVRYGDWTGLMKKLLQDWLDEQKRENQP